MECCLKFIISNNGYCIIGLTQVSLKNTFRALYHSTLPRLPTIWHNLGTVFGPTTLGTTWAQLRQDLSTIYEQLRHSSGVIYS